MTDKIIEEVMGLVDELVGESMAGGMCSIATNPDVAKQAPDFAKAITTLKSSIRSKLREVLERKPMQREEMLKLAYPIRWDELDDREQAAAIGFGRAVEIYHGIHHQIGAK